MSRRLHRRSVARVLNVEPPVHLLRRTALLVLPAAAIACGHDRAAARDTTGLARAASHADSVGGDTAIPAASTATDRGPSAPGVPVQPGPGAAVQTRTAGGSVVPASVTGGPVASRPVASGSVGGPAPTSSLAPPPQDGGPQGTAAQTTPPPAPPQGSGSTAPQAVATPAAAPAATPPMRRATPWAPGERLTYDVKFGPIRVGSGTMEVTGIEPIRGHDTYHTVFRVKGGTLVYKVNDRYESWMDVSTLASLQHVQDIDEGSYERNTRYEIFPDRRIYIEYKKKGPVEQPTVEQPLDDGSFIYFVRALPELEVGKTYTFNNYFRPDRNPVTLHVARRERIEVPAGKFDALVVQPRIKTTGIFGEGGNAELWFADDSTRILLQMKSQLKFGSLNLYLRSYRKPQDR